MTRKRTKGTKYNRITKQQKYLFLKLCVSQRLSIQEAAHKASIHYSTAKTILFFHRKQYKNYETFIINDCQATHLQNSHPRAFYKDIEIDDSSSGSPRSRIEVISKCYTKPIQKNSWRKYKTHAESDSQEQSMGCARIRDESVEIKEWCSQMQGGVKQQEVSMKRQLTEASQKTQPGFRCGQCRQDEKK